MKSIAELLVAVAAVCGILTFAVAEHKRAEKDNAPIVQPDANKITPKFPRLRKILEEQVEEDEPIVGLERGTIGGDASPDGTEQVQVDILDRLRVKNVGGSDGAGLCVFTSIMHSARDQTVRPLMDLQAYMRKQPGGGYPTKVDTVLQKFVKKDDYLQYEGSDLGVLRAALESGRSPGVTYDGTYAPTKHYGGKKISHMVNLVHLSDKWAGVLDNNFPHEIVWMTPDAFQKTWAGGRSQGWAVILLEPAAAPPCHN